MEHQWVILTAADLCKLEMLKAVLALLRHIVTEH